MTTKPSDLIAIANSELAQKLAKESDKQDAVKEKSIQKPVEKPHQTFQQDVWRAVFTLNLFRYAVGIILLIGVLLPEMNPGWNPIDNLMYPDLFMYSAVALLCSAAAFTYMTHYRKAPLNQILIAQLALDLVFTACITHATGSISSSFIILYFIVVTTGSVVLQRKHALALASGGFILLCYEHLYSVLKKGAVIEQNYDLLAGYGLFMMFAASLVSYLAQRVRMAELKSFVPGSQTIEEFLVREEVNALKSALETTNGNKTEAAKLLGMTFRSFRYKLTKYDID